MGISHNTPRHLPALITAVLAAIAMGIIPSSVAIASEGCPNEQARHESNTNPATGQPYDTSLPECRAYEMVSPLDKQAHDANVALGGPLVSPDGDAVGFGSEGAFAEAENYLVNISPHNTYIARRSSDGWATESALAPASVISKPTLFGFNGDASLDLSTLASCGNVADVVGAQGSSPNFACAIRGPGRNWAKTPDYTDLSGEAPSTPVYLWGSSSDLSDIVWQPGDLAGLLPGDNVSGGSGAIYETIGLGGVAPQLRMVSVNDENTPLTIDEHGKDGPYLGAARQSPTVSGSTYQAISSDGQTVYFTAEPAGGGCLTLYARTGDFAGGTPAVPTTVEIGCDATFFGASADGSKVFFITPEQLVSTDIDSTSDLYEYNFDAPAGHHYTQVSAGGLGDPSPGSGAEVSGVTSISSDGSHVYFSSGAVLTTLPNGDGQHASQGSANVYGYDTETGQTQFVADVTNDGEPSIDQVTPDGRYLIFTTTAHLSPEDTNNGRAVYRYDFQTGEVTWVSHPAPEFPALDEGDNATLFPIATEEEKAMAYLGDARRAISENGEFIIFTTSEKLQANDVNSAPDVYLWHDETVSLISDGQNPVGVTEVPGMSASGSDIVFATTSKLVGQDTDDLQDIYDAKIDGGFPAPKPEPSCSGESCQGSRSAPPAFGAADSESFVGVGNLTPGPISFPTPSKAKPKSLTRAQKLAKALKTCRVRNRIKQRRLSCEEAAHKRYASARRATANARPR
jgi:hypothetical protein